MIGEVVSKGEFLSHEHTRKNWRRELSIASGLVDRSSYGDWEAAGAKTAADRAAAEVERLLAKSDVPPLAEETEVRIEEIMKAEAAAVGLDALPDT